MRGTFTLTILALKTHLQAAQMMDFQAVRKQRCATERSMLCRK